MKRFTMAAAAVLIAGGVFAQSSSLVQVYNFMASVKNSNVGTREDRKANSLYDYKFAEMNILGGFLVVPACTDCSFEPEGSAVLYLYRLRDTSKKLYKLSAAFALVDVFATRADYNGLVLGREAEGFLAVDPVYNMEDMSGFFNSDVDLGNTKLWAAGFGRVSQGRGYYEEIPSQDPCLPPEQVWIPGCVTLETLCGQIVGILEYNYVCAPPYLMLCSSFLDCVNSTQNAVLSGSWQIRRNRAMESFDLSEAESKVLSALSAYYLYNNPF